MAAFKNGGLYLRKKTSIPDSGAGHLTIVALNDGKIYAIDENGVQDLLSNEVTLAQIVALSAQVDTNTADISSNYVYITNVEAQVHAISANYATISLVQTVSGNLQDQIDDIIASNVDGSGVANAVAYFTDTNTVTGTSSFTYAGNTLALTNAGATGISFNDGTATWTLESDGTGEFVVRAGATEVISSTSTALGIKVDTTVDGDLRVNQDLIVIGNTTLQGTVVYLDSQNVLIEDNIITLSSNVSGSPILSSGIEVERGIETTAQLIFDENIDAWVFGLSGDLGIIPVDTTLVHKTGAESISGNKTFENTTTFNSDVVVTDFAGFANQVVIVDALGTLQLSGVTVSDITGNTANLTELYTLVNEISGNVTTLRSDVDSISANYATIAYVDGVSGNLQTQINSITILGGEGILVQNPTDLTWVVSVSGDYALVSELTSVSGALQTQINAIEVDITSLSGSIDTLSSYITDISANYATIAYVDGISGNLLAEIEALEDKLLTGSVTLDTTNTVYTVSNTSITTNSKPVCSLVIPANGDAIYIQGVTNVQNGSFDIVLSEVPEIVGYEVNWIAYNNI